MADDILGQLRTAVVQFQHATDPPRSLNWIAGQFGVPVPTLTRWLNGERSISAETAAKVATRLGLELKPMKSRKS
jgi:plasmid maintenance system antidote protein VapI